MGHSGSCSAAATRARSCNEAIVVAEQGRQFRTERHPRRAGQSREVDDQIRMLGIGQRQRVAQHQPAFRIGVADLDGQALAGGEHIAGPVGIAADGVFHRRHQHAQLAHESPRS